MFTRSLWTQIPFSSLIVNSVGNPRESRGFTRHAPLSLWAWPIVASFLFFMPGSGLLAHEPLFMASHEAPGKGAFDMHLEITAEGTEDGEDEAEYEIEGTWGLTRDLAVQVALPFVVESGGGGSISASGFGDPSVNIKWRFWDHDVLGAKYALAAFLNSTVPVGEEEFGRDRPSFLAGLAHGREGLKHYYFFDVRYAYAVDDDGDQPGDILFLDASYGWRPGTRGLMRTDVVFFFEANWEDHDPDRHDDILDPTSGGRFFSLAAEALISPFNRLMIRGGVQVPVSQSIPLGAARRDPTFRLAIETRF